MRQEPFNTLLTQGYTVTISQPQLSYRVLTLEENQLIDFVVDLTDDDLQTQNPIPYYEISKDQEYTRTDVSFFFNIPATLEPTKKARTAEASTITFDHKSLSPLIDQFRTAATNWKPPPKNLSPVKPPSTLPHKITLTSNAPP